MIPVVVGSSPIVHPNFKAVSGPLAQLVEQLTLNQLVVGSIPTRPTSDRRTRSDAGPFYLHLNRPKAALALVLVRRTTVKWSA